MKYRKKPVEVEAFKWTADSLQEEDPIWIVEAIKKGTVKIIANDSNWAPHDTIPIMRIKTLEGIMCAKMGDYIIKGISGEIYPCKPDIFEKTYEIVD